MPRLSPNTQLVELPYGQADYRISVLSSIMS